MTLIRAVKSAIIFLSKGDWHELYIRTLTTLGILDFNTITTDKLNLSADQANSYSDTGRDYFQKVLASFNIQKTDAIVDFGSGKGGALITLTDYHFKKITGVEVSRQLVAVARKNLARLRIKNVNIVCCDAKEFIDIDEYNYFYFFNPFPCTVMQAVVENIKQSVKRNNRKITIIYLNPICHDEILRDNIFSLVKEYKHHDHSFFVYNNNLC